MNDSKTASARTRAFQTLRDQLLKQRDGILATSSSQQDGVNALKNQERDPEYEEGAQSAQADYTLSALLESQRAEVEQIDAALRRMDDGKYGLCVECKAEIGLERLSAVPFTVRCEECAEEQERSDTTLSPHPTL